MTKIKTQSGFTLLELMLVLAIAAGMAIIQIQDALLKSEQRAASQLGAEIHMVATGVQKYVAFHSGSQSTIPADPQNGVSWLFGDKCNTGVASREHPDFISLCGFLQNPDGSETTRFGRLKMTTTFKTDPGNNYLESITVFDELKVQGQHRADLAGLAAMVANGIPSVDDPSSATPQMASDVFVAYCIEGGRRDGIYQNCLNHDRQIVVVTTNSSASDRWLRTDHGNNMKNILEFDDSVTGTDSNGFSLRQIKNVARLYNKGTDPLYIGKRGRVPTMADVGFVVDADQEILGKLRVSYGDIEVTSDPVTGQGGNVIAEKDITAGQDVIATNDAKVGNDLNVSNNATIEKDTTTSRIFDFDDPTFYLDPNSVSNVKELTGEKSTINDMKADKLGSIGNTLNVESNKDINLKGSGVNGSITMDAKTVDFTDAKLKGFVDVSELVVRTKGGSIVPLVDILPKKSLVQTYVVKMPNNNFVPRPNCASRYIDGHTTTYGQPQIVVVPTIMESHGKKPTSSNVIRTKWFVTASSSWLGWFVQAKSSYADLGTGVAIAMTYCSYP